MIQNCAFEPGITWSYILVQYDFCLNTRGCLAHQLAEENLIIRLKMSVK